MYLLIPEYIADLVIFIRDKYIGKPSLLRLQSQKFAILGDTHGAIDMTFRGSTFLKDGYMVIMLGDLVDRGHQSLFNLLFALEVNVLSDNFIILRGNHESSLTTPYYGFLNELKDNSIDMLYDEFL